MPEATATNTNTQMKSWQIITGLVVEPWLLRLMTVTGPSQWSQISKFQWSQISKFPDSKSPDSQIAGPLISLEIFEMSVFSSVQKLWMDRCGSKPKGDPEPEEAKLPQPPPPPPAPRPPSRYPSLLLFPLDIQLSVVYEWLDCFDISRLDVSFCSHSKRQCLLDLLSSPCPFSQWVFRKSFANDKLLTWLAKRKVAMCKLSLLHIGNESDFAQFPAFCRSLRFLDLSNLDQLTDAHMAHLLAVCRGTITHVRLDHCPAVSWSTVDLLITHSPQLQSLELTEIAFNRGQLQGGGSPPTKVVHLVLRAEEAIRPAVNPLPTLFAACPLLQTLHFGLLLANSDWVSIAGRGPVHKLILDAVAIDSPHVFQQLSLHLPQLTDLQVYKLTGLSQGIQGHVQGVAVADADLAYMCSFMGLRRLHFGSDRLTDALLCRLASNSTQLTHLVLSNAKRVTDASVAVLATCCNELLEVFIGHSELTDASVRKLLQGCPKLRKLAVPYSRLTYESMLHVAEHGKLLEEVDIFGNSSIVTEQSVALLKESILGVLLDCPHLSKLNIDSNGLDLAFVESIKAQLERRNRMKFSRS